LKKIPTELEMNAAKDARHIEASSTSSRDHKKTDRQQFRKFQSPGRLEKKNKTSFPHR
jgi:hypothetical protein